MIECGSGDTGSDLEPFPGLVNHWQLEEESVYGLGGWDAAELISLEIILICIIFWC